MAKGVESTHIAGEGLHCPQGGSGQLRRLAPGFEFPSTFMTSGLRARDCCGISYPGFPQGEV